MEAIYLRDEAKRRIEEQTKPKQNKNKNSQKTPKQEKQKFSKTSKISRKSTEKENS